MVTLIRHVQHALERKSLLSLGLLLVLALSGTIRNDERGTVKNELKPQHSGFRVQGSAFERLPLSFEANQGQTDPQVKFLSRGSGYSLFLTSTEAVLTLDSPQRSQRSQRSRRKISDSISASSAAAAVHSSSSAVLQMKLLDANPAPHVAGLEALPGKINYFIGNGPTQWRTNVPSYAKVKYEAVYPGVDLIYYGNQRQLEYDFVVAPGADPNAITLGFAGADWTEIDDQGDLVLHTSSGQVRQHKPRVYQNGDGQRVDVRGEFKILDSPAEHSPLVVGFEIGEYDHTKSLVIDPTLVYSTYLGGSDFEGGLTIESTYQGVAVDAEGNVYLAGRTESTDFPTANPFQAMNRGGFFGADAFVVKLNAAGSALIYATYLGSSQNDEARDIAVDAEGNAYVTGAAGASDFPTTPGAFGTTSGRVFVTKLNPAGSALVYSAYFGGLLGAEGQSIAVDADGNAYVVGTTVATDFPTTPGAFQTARRSGEDVFVTKLNASGSSLRYSTYLGGDGTDRGLNIAVDAAGNACVTGRTTSMNFPTERPIQAAFGGGPPIGDAFVTKFNATGSALVYSTYLGGSGADEGSSIAVDAEGNAYVTGQTNSANFRTTAQAFQRMFGGTFPQADAFVTKLDGIGMLVYSTYLGGSSNDTGRGIAVDAAGNAHVIGTTFSANFPRVSPFQSRAGAGTSNDAFVTKFNATGALLLYSSYFGGNGHVHEAGINIAVDAAGNTYVTGQTDSTNFLTVNALQRMISGTRCEGADQCPDAFVAKIGP
jgi:hypothetical protein